MNKIFFHHAIVSAIINYFVRRFEKTNETLSILNGTRIHKKCRFLEYYKYFYQGIIKTKISI